MSIFYASILYACRGGMCGITWYPSVPVQARSLGFHTGFCQRVGGDGWWHFCGENCKGAGMDPIVIFSVSKGDIQGMFTNICRH